MKNILLLCFTCLTFLSCKNTRNKNYIKEIEYNGDNENAQYIDKNAIIKASLNNTKETNDIDVYRLVNSNDYVLSLSIKQTKNVNILVSIETLSGRNIFSMIKNNNIKIPLYNIKDDNIFLSIESINSVDKIYYNMKIDFLDEYFNNIETKPNNTFYDAINILSPDNVISGTFLNLNQSDRFPNQVITNTAFENITDIDIYRLRNPTDIDLNINLRLEYHNMDRAEILLFDSRYNLISKYKSASSIFNFKKNTTYYVALVYSSDIISEENYNIYYTVE